MQMAKIRKNAAIAGMLGVLSCGVTAFVYAQGGPSTAQGGNPGGQGQSGGSMAQDPGVRAGSVGAGKPLATLTAEQVQYFEDGLTRFLSVDSVSGTVRGESGNGLGPGFNSNS